MLVTFFYLGVDACDGYTRNHGRAFRMVAVYFDRATKPVEIAVYGADKLMNAKADLGMSGINFVSLGGCAHRSAQHQAKTADLHQSPLSRVTNLSNAGREDGSRPKRCPSAIAALGFAP